MLKKNTLIYYLIVILFSSNPLDGQKLSSPTSLGGKLTGVWQWTNAKDSFTIQLFIIDSFFKSWDKLNVFGPQIYGWHKYVENGVLIESSFPEYLPQRPFSKGIAGTIMNGDSAQLWFRDITRGRTFRVEVEILDSAATLMKWTTNQPQERQWYPPPKPKIWEGQTIPSPIILHKISE